jgi:hypothetical protein
MKDRGIKNALKNEREVTTQKQELPINYNRKFLGICRQKISSPSEREYLESFCSPNFISILNMQK